MKIYINPKDIRRDTFRAGGKGGQHQNKTESAVRFTHVPTGLAAESRGERSQHQNSELAWTLLIAKLNRYFVDRQRASRDATYKAKPDAAFGHQIRTYRLVDDRRVIDHRTGVSGDAQQVIGRGRIDDFLMANLRQAV